MKNKKFLDACDFIQTHLINLEVNNIFNSIESNVFFEFGQDKEITFGNGRTSMQKEWSIWISDASWRFSQQGKYIVGSGDPSQVIQLHIQKLLGKRFQSFHFLSHRVLSRRNFLCNHAIPLSTCHLFFSRYRIPFFFEVPL